MGTLHKSHRLTFKEKIGYGSAAAGDTIGYSFPSTYLLFFLTTVAGIQPAIAGTLTIIYSIWDAIYNPIIGYISDHAKTRWGRRRPFIFGFSIPLLMTMILLFTNVPLPYYLKVIYYGFMGIAFWTAFTGFFVPYYALGAEYTNDYEERTTLRAFASFFNLIGTWFAMVLPTAMVQVLENMGFETDHAWTLTAAGIGVLCTISIMITVAASKKFDICDETELVEKEKVNVSAMLKEYVEVIKLKPMKWLIVASTGALIAYTMLTADIIYLFTYKLNFTGAGISLAMAVRTLSGAAFLPLGVWLCKIMDKRNVFIIVMMCGSAGLVICRFLPLENLAILVFFIVASNMANSAYWQIMPAIFYDVCEYDEYKTGNRREGAIVSVQGLVEAIAEGAGAQLLGIILQMAGFNGSEAVQGPLAIEWIYNCGTWMPVVFLAAAAFALYKFPITKELYYEILNKLEERKKEGQ